jgi:hypothetical protein
MKKSNVFTFLSAVLISAFLAGCYTQVDWRDRDYGRDTGYTENNEDQRYGDTYEETYADSGYTDYYDSTETVINNYYYGGYPLHRRYYSYYYPRFSVGFHFGWYDPFYSCWDPYYWWDWCGTGAYFYYPYYGYPYYWSYYYPYYYGGYSYYSGSHYYGGHYKYRNLRERTRDVYTTRNNDGLRGTRDRNMLIPVQIEE